MKKSRIVIAAPKSGSGKTLISIALMKAFSLNNQNVRAFKCGPDYIDPMFHKKILGIPSKNLDLFFSSENQIKEIFLNENNSDISIIEGVMGLFDGLGGFTQDASTYEVAKALEAPIILVIDAKGMGYSVLAELKGFLLLDKFKLIKGIILNNLSSMIFRQIKHILEEETKIKVLGYFPTQKQIKIESRYLGLTLPDEIKDIQDTVDFSAKELVKTIDLKEINNIAIQAPDISFKKEKNFIYKNIKDIKIAVAKDEAFCFYYEDNLKLLKNLGAELIYFSPIHDSKLPENISGIILGGGYPELFAKEISLNENMKKSIREKIENGIPSLAECGGFMYLHDSIKPKDGNEYKMVGIVPGTCEFKNKLIRFGYISLEEKEEIFYKSKNEINNKIIKGHEFHYFDSTNNGTSCIATKPVSNRTWECCHVSENHWWGFAHLYYPSNIDFVINFIEKCRGYK